jgi:hypothetical protein
MATMTDALRIAKMVKPVARVRLAGGGTGDDDELPQPQPKKGLMSIFKRGQTIMPSTPDPTPQELAAARADTRGGGNIVNQRLNTIIPESSRVVGGNYTPGAPNGGRWLDMGDHVLNRPGAGFKVTDEELHNLWHHAVNESSQAAKDAVMKHNVKPIFGAHDWDQAMRLPLRDHLWYELSGEKMAENMPDLTPAEYLKAMDLVGATSARADPGENLERALAVMSQHMRNVPIDVDLTQPATVRDALSRDHTAGSSALSGNKTGHFSDTLALTGGVPTRFPISVNDVWVGKMFGIPDKVMSSNQSLHEPMALYFNKIRDLYNERHGDEVPFKYQSWNFQAPAWVHLRNEPSGDAYHQVWGGIINKLKQAGVPGIEGDKITREAFMHPKFADALRRTTPEWREAPKATVEFGTKLTDIGQQAHDLYHAAINAGDMKSQQEYLKPLITSMYHSARGEDHPWDALKKAITGDVTGKSDITRIMHPTTDEPNNAGGTFEGAVSPNIRVPLKGMNDDQIAMFNSIAGKHLKQASMAASQVHRADEADEPRPDHIRGYSLFIPTQEEMSGDEFRSLANKLNEAGHDMSFTRYPNGYMVDALPHFDENGARGIDAKTLHDAYWGSLGNRFGNTPKIMAHDFKSVYNPESEYNDHIKNLKKAIQNDYIQAMVGAGLSKDLARQTIKKPEIASNFKGRSRKAWDTYTQRSDYLAKAESGFQDLARAVNDGHKSFLESAGKRRQKLGYKRGGFVHPARSIPGVHIDTSVTGEPMFTGRR